ncbi:MAG: ABC transporter permease, partial [Romboutsia sp.]|nr:ABC transporter permease [Romboutsia sp.]
MNIFRVLYRYMRKTNFIVLCIISILLFFSLIVGNIENITRSILEVNNQLTKNHIGIGFNDELENKEVIELINKIKSNKNIIIKYYLQNGFDYDIQSEGIFFNGVFNNSYNLLDGRFFTTEDFNKNNKLAVIGKDVLKYTKVNGNKRYIFRGLDRYEVIGIIGKDDLSSKYDNKIIYNLDSILNDDEILNKYTWWVDSYDKNKSEIKDIISNIGNNALIQIIDSTATPPNPLQEALTLSKT